jgi:mycofactocin precursor
MAESATELLDRPAEQAADLRQPEAADPQPDEVIAADLLVEEISIDGMCGVY